MTMERLDAISPRNPVVLITQVGSRPRAANTKAFELAKIAPGTPGLPQDGGVLIAGEAGPVINRLFDVEHSSGEARHLAPEGHGAGQ